jgi:hypothetical protein
MQPTIHAGHAITERLLDWFEQAAHAGRQYRADGLLLLAWRSYDRPTRQPGKLIVTTEHEITQRLN